MRAGGIRVQMRIEKPVGSPADFGEGWEGWKYVREPWVNLRPTSGNEKPENTQVVAITSHEIRCRIDPEKPITTEMRGRLGDRTFAFKQVIDVDERGREYLILADEIT